eukprot:TRINITY_DN17596_c0_g3_i2.p1 TRINITY_DN17596_c0_g3~~TRINITY_DN17596_c0_g3_i2.p1  ORF type:complete len:212 (+),score=30.53 TRINITY_DN17596_c0_g3_i2:150-785(+)
MKRKQPEATCLPQPQENQPAKLRRSQRRTSPSSKCEMETLKFKLAGLSSFKNPTSEDFDLEIFHHPEKGRSVRTKEAIPCGKYVCEYRGELLSGNALKQRQELYKSPAFAHVGCFMFYFRHDSRLMCLDATLTDGNSSQPSASPDPRFGFGRLINHSRVDFNLIPRKVVDYYGRVRIAFFSSRDIALGEELLFDYNDRDKLTAAAFPWLKT